MPTLGTGSAPMERELTVLETERANERIAVVETQRDGVACVELRFQQDIVDFGWVTQRRVSIDASQVNDLRLALTLFASTNTEQCRKPQVVSFASLQTRASMTA